jgi:Bacteriophage replication protein O
VARHLIPNSTQIPDVILDHWMARLSGAELKVLLYIARRTFGFGKANDRISLSQLADGITKRDGSVLDRGTGISRSSVARALITLETMGMVLRQSNLADTGKEFDENTYSINLAWEPADDSGGSPISSSGNGIDGDSGGVVPKSDHPTSKNTSATKAKGVVRKSDQVVAKKEGGWSENGTGVVPKSDQQETDLQETAATSTKDQGDAAAAADYQALVKKLTSNGVGHTVAEELARSHPDACHRCLEFLPFAKIRSSKGAFLANAIRHGYGPPKGYEEAQRRLARNGADSAKNGGPISQRIGHLATPRTSDLRARFLALREKCPEEHVAFLVFEKEEKSKVERISRRLSAKRRSQVLSEWEDDAKCLERYERWLRIRGVSPSHPC